MIPKYADIHPKFRLNGKSHNAETLKELAETYLNTNIFYKQHIGRFLLEWFNEKDYVLISTSGSTGAPKTIQILKQAMINSALATGSFFNLKPGDTALHCLPSHFIAGKMMLVRGLVLGLNLFIVEPSSSPLKATTRTFDFCAMVPLQVQNSLQQLPQIKTLIVGGASMSEALIAQVRGVSTKIYATYGMTETVTHIAVKSINPIQKTHFKTLPQVTISKDNRDCLVIDAPQLSETPVVTNDIVEIISDSEFKLLGRYDNVINSGGIKLIPEQIEKQLESVIPHRFFVASQPDEVLGERLILIVESEKETITPSMFETLNTYERPKNIYYIKKFAETQTSKINRQATLDLIK